jgi:phage/plasmid primase-like uncharacterized protein
MAIDHKTCGHVDHTTLDGSRHEEMHTAIFGLISKWSSAANHHDQNAKQARSYETAVQQERLAAKCRSMIDDLVKAMRPFEIEQ